MATGFRYHTGQQRQFSDSGFQKLHPEIVITGVTKRYIHHVQMRASVWTGVHKTAVACPINNRYRLYPHNARFTVTLTHCMRSIVFPVTSP